MKSLQETYSPNGICFGCGPMNEKGLKIKSFVENGQAVHDAPQDVLVVAEFTPESHHEAFPGMVNGGIMGSLLDCHSNWAAAYILMKQANLTTPPCTVTADFHVKLRAPTPSHQKIKLKAKGLEIQRDRVKVEAQAYTVNPDGTEKLTATCVGTFVAVKEGHPAFHRW